MKMNLKRSFAFFITLVMLFSMVPAVELHVHAATSKDFSGSTVTNLGMSATDATGSGSPTCSWTASGNTISGSLVGGYDGSGYNHYYYQSTSTLTLTNNTGKKAVLAFNYSVETQGSDYGDITVNGTKYTSSATGKSVSVTLENGESITVILNVPERKKGWWTDPEKNGASISITGITLTPDDTVTVNFGTATNGSYTVTDASGNTVDLSSALSAKAIDSFNLTATPESGYSFAGWYYKPEGGTESFWSGLATYENALFDQSGTYVPKFIPTEDGIWGVGEAVFDDLNNAIAAANASSNDKTIVPLQDVTISGEYTIPAGVTLHIPFDAEHTMYGANPAVIEGADSNWTTPTAYRTLTMASGSKLIINGVLEISAKHYCSMGGNTIGGSVYKTYGCISMNAGSSIEVNDKAILYAWGYIKGDGEVKAYSGSTVYEKMQIADYRGGTATTMITGINKGKKLFPFSQYYVQNIEVKEYIYAGASIVAHTGVYAENVETATLVFVGSGDAMFKLESGYVVKWYDGVKDYLIFDVYGNISISPINVTALGMTIDSSEYRLGINSNIAIHAYSGSTVKIAQDLVLHPGVNVTVDAGATMENSANLFIVDNNDWGLYCRNFEFIPIQWTTVNGSTAVRTSLDDVIIDINGTVKSSGKIYTSTNGNNSIISSKKTGMYNILTAPGSSTSINQVTGADWTANAKGWKTITMYPAVLTNGIGTTTATSGAAAGSTFYYSAVQQ